MPALNLVALKCGLFVASGVAIFEAPAFLAQATGSSGALSNQAVVYGAWAGMGIAVGSAIGTALAASIKAFGDSILKPMLDQRAYKRERDELASQVTTLRSVQEAMGVRMTAVERDRDLAVSSSMDLARDLRKALDDAYRLARHMGTNQGQFQPAESPQIPPLVVGASPRSQTGPRVLLVEDDLRSRDIMAVMLTAVGFRVDTAGTLGEAFQCLDAHTPDFLVLDLMLPGSDGIEVFRAIRDRRLPTVVIVTTGKGKTLAEAVLEPVRALNPDHFIAKPYNFETELFPKLAAGFLQPGTPPPSIPTHDPGPGAARAGS